MIRFKELEVTKLQMSQIDTSHGYELNTNFSFL